MSEGNFEVMPIGTIAEVKAVRKLSNELIELVDRDADLEEIVDKINELRDFYNWHVAQFPVTV